MTLMQALYSKNKNTIEAYSSVRLRLFLSACYNQVFKCYLKHQEEISHEIFTTALLRN